MDQELIAQLRLDLTAADYTVEQVQTILGAEADGARLRGIMQPACRSLAERPVSAVSLLIRLLLLGQSLTEHEVNQAFPKLGCSGACALGLLETEATPEASDPGHTGVESEGAIHPHASFYRAAVSLNPVEIADPIREQPYHWWLLSDLDDQLRRSPARADHVMGVGGATRSLILQAPTARVEQALDLGTGCGVVALHLSLRGSVTATDISERALMFARANALLNAVTGIEFVVGDLFSPVAGQHFDLILSNPPFVVTPRSVSTTYEYRDAGMVGDALAERVVMEAPAYLSPGGTLLCLANWESPWGVDGAVRVTEWIESGAQNAGLPAPALASWVIERDRVSPLQYAETWARDGGARPGDPAFEEMITQWLEDFTARRIVAIGLGAIRITRLAQCERESVSVRHSERASGGYSARAGLFLQQHFAAAVHAERMSADELLATHWHMQPGATEVREYVPGTDAPTSITLSNESGIARSFVSDPLLAAAVGASDGDLTLGQICDALATILEVDREAAAEALVSGMRELAWMGMIAPWPTRDTHIAE